MPKMTNHLQLCSAAVIAVVCGVLVAPATADTLTYTAAWPETTPANWLEVLELPLFDPSYGTLQAVDLQVHATFRGQWRYENGASVPGIYHSERTWTQTVTDLATGNALFFLEPEDWILDGTVGAWDGVLDFGGTSGITVDYNAPDEIQQIALGNIASFVGTGTRSFEVSGTSFFAITVSPAFYWLGSQSWSSSELTITYTYVPEPTALALLALGAMVARRR